MYFSKLGGWWIACKAEADEAKSGPIILISFFLFSEK